MFKMFKLVIDSLKQTCLNVGYSSFTGDNPKKNGAENTLR